MKTLNALITGRKKERQDMTLTEERPMTEPMKESMDALGTDRLYAKVDIERLKIDPTYQRDVRNARVKKMVAEFDERLLGVLACSVRADGIYVIDGQHRLEMLKRLGIDKVQCELRTGLSVEEEANMFWHLDSDRQGLGGDDAFKAMLVAKDPVALAVKAAIEDAGLTIAYRPMPGGVRAYKTLIWLANARTYGIDVVRDVLSVLGQAWPEDHRVATTWILKGVAQFLVAYPEVGRKELARTLAEHSSPSRLTARGRMIMDGMRMGSEQAMAKAVLATYNFKRSTHALEDRL